jgi:hypothetical protein
MLSEYERQAKELSKTFDLTLEKAWRFGQKLCEIKAQVGHGNWQLWLANNLGDRMSDRTARRHMELDTDNPGAESVHELSAESVRKFKIGFVPAKDRPKIDGDVSFARPTHHLSLVNDWRKFVRRVEIGQATLDAPEARRDMRPLFDWLCSLYGITSEQLVALLGRDWQTDLEADQAPAEGTAAA